MTDREKFAAGYQYAQEENAALAGVVHDPAEPGLLADTSAWQRGYERFRDEQDQAP